MRWVDRAKQAGLPEDWPGHVCYQFLKQRRHGIGCVVGLLKSEPDHRNALDTERGQTCSVVRE